MLRSFSRAMPWVAGLLAALGPGAGARADGVNATLSPSYLNSHTETTVGGETQRVDADALLQDYRLQAERTLFPHLGLSLGGSFQRSDFWSHTEGASLGSVSGRTDTTSDDVFARFKLSSGFLGVGGGYDRHESRASGLGPPEVRESYDLASTWRPADLPALSLVYRHTLTYDRDRLREDRRDDSVALKADYSVSRLNLHSSTSFLRTDDVIGGIQSDVLEQTLRADWGDALLDHRLNYHLDGSVGLTSVRSSIGGAGGTVANQRFPTGGFSLVEAFPATPELDTLTPNPALVDGNVQAAAGLNLGFSRSIAGDTAPRDMGVQFGDLVTQVNSLWVWLDRALPLELVGHLDWRVYYSNDNVAWTRLNIQSLKPGQLDNRVEIGIPDIAARYLKVVAIPLPVGVTTDPRYADIQVTEVQAFQYVSAGSISPRHDEWTRQLDGSSRLLLVKEINLAHDLTFQLRGVQGRTLWSVINGLSAERRLATWLNSSARASQSLSDVGTGVETIWAAGANLVATPLPTLYHALSIGWQRQEASASRPGSSGVSANVFSRADLYQGVNLNLNVSGNRGTNSTGFEGTTVVTTSGLSITPHRRVSVSGGFFHQWSRGSKNGVTTEQVLERWDVNASVTPTDALSLSGSVSRLVRGPAPTTTANGSLAYSPLNGDLQLSLSYTRTYDSATDSSSMTLSPTLRWAIGPGALISASYALSSARTPASDIEARAFTVNFVLTLG